MNFPFHPPDGLHELPSIVAIRKFATSQVMRGELTAETSQVGVDGWVDFGAMGW